MTRWKPDAPGRLAQAAMELYSERGFEQTTVTEIAAQAGLTERTFFRHFADKREVLFAGAGSLQESVTSAVFDAPESATPVNAAISGVEAASAVLQQGREFSRKRQAVINANTELRERELIKLASLGAAIADALRRRGAKEPAASLAAEIAIAVFKAAFQRWVSEKSRRTLQQLIRESLADLRVVANDEQAG